MNNIKIKKIMIGVLKLSVMAVCADLFYIIARMRAPVETIDDLSFVLAVPDMLEHMLISAVVIMMFGALGSYVLADGERRGQ